MKKVEWLASDRVIPTCGVVATGQLIALPTEWADKFIAQGEARIPVEVPTKKTTKEVEV
jgi:hypothetical protein